MRRLIFLWLLCCISQAGIAANHVPPQMRLGDAVKPIAYDVDLKIVPENDQFEGKIHIDMEIARELNFFWINATDLEVSSAELTPAAQAPQAAQLLPTAKDFLGLQFAAPLKAGRARLTLTYRGKLYDKNTSGLFRQKEGADWYVISQFQASYARRAFPCFDEPHWKTPWKIAITHKAEHIAASNMPQTKVQDLAGGMRRVEFATTPPLPSYLVAMGVGPFDVVDGGKAGRKQTELRYFVPRGRASEAVYARQVTPKILSLAEEYFDSPYPFAKLDSMVMPVSVGFAAMENVGLITYRAGVLLHPPGSESEDFKQRYVSIAAHEIAHQWFGNLVTMQWWDDLWLNESFATWMAGKLTAQFNPKWDNAANDDQERLEAMQLDRLQTTRQVRQAIVLPKDMEGAFDSITYDKGGAVLRMFEQSLGEQKFRAGVQRYLHKHAFGNASAHDFFAAFNDTDKANADSPAQAMNSFVSQPGLPQLQMRIACGKKTQIELHQQRFLPAAHSAAKFAHASKSAKQQWQIPVCIRHAGNPQQKHCILMKQERATISLPDAKTCPAWIAPNAGNGYYLAALPLAQLLALQKAGMPVSEQTRLNLDLGLMAASGHYPAADLLQWLSAQANDPRPEILLSVVLAYRQIPATWLPANQGTWLRQHFGALAQKLSWLEQAEDSDASKNLRRELLTLLTERGADRVLQQQAQQLAMQWLSAQLSGQTPPSLGVMLQAVMRGALASEQRKTVLEMMLALVGQHRHSRERQQLYRAIGHVPADLQKPALEAMFATGLDMRESIDILNKMAENLSDSEILMDFVRSRRELLLSRMPERYLLRMPMLGEKLCKQSDRDAWQAMFATPKGETADGARRLMQTLEAIDICVAARPSQEAQLQKFFASH